MKRFFIIAAALLAAVCANAQVGIIGGLTTSDIELKDVDVKAVNLFHVGITDKISLPLGFAIQPSLTYNVKGTQVGDIKLEGIASAKFDTKTAYLELPVQIQWGIDLGIARPYIFAEPFIGYAIGQKQNIEAGSHLAGDPDRLDQGSADQNPSDTGLPGSLGSLIPGGSLLGDVIASGTYTAGKDYKWDAVNRLEYGCGIGVGVEFLKHIQVSFRYFWDMGGLYKDNELSASFKQITGYMKDNKASGMKLSVAYLF